LTLWGFIEVLFYAFYKRSIGFALRFLGNFLLTIAINIDITLNAIIQVPANRILINDDGYKFGQKGDTFSRALGVNLVNDTFKGNFGIYICKFLHLLDKNHCEKSAI
jgi:hypothetical protein